MAITTRHDSLVERYLFSPLYTPRNLWSVVGWWERRRLFYNVAVGLAGLVTTATALLLNLLTPGTPGPTGPPLLLIPVYALAANLFYSLGAPIDLLLRRQLKEDAGPVAQALFRYGLAFSVGLTLLPIPIIVFGTIMMVLTR